ncbi:MAG: DUF2079 domain-containing protein [Acidimicrobiia bacterium]|nr:DUF2079 domain-containing protein [Acidimicrobiia bacterium]
MGDESLPAIGAATASSERPDSPATAPPAAAPRATFGVLGPRIVLGSLILVWVAVFGVLVWQRHDRFGTFGFDLGIFDQTAYLLSRLDSQFITVRGLDVFGHHANLGLVLFAPFYRLGAGPHFLNLFQVVVMALGAVPVYLLARHRIAREWPAVLLAGVFLLHPALQFLAWETFHPETVAITPLLCAYYASVRKRWGWFALWVTAAVVWKEDVALAVAVLGLIVAVRGHRQIGVVTFVAALSWFLLVSQVLLPTVNGDQAFYNQFFGDLGNSPYEIANNALRDPSLVTQRLGAPDAREYLWMMLAPFGFLSLLAPLVLLIGVPQVLVNLLSVNDFTRSITFHYAALPLAALTLGMVEGVAWLFRRLTRRWAQRVLLAGLVAAAVAATVAWGPSPVGVRYDEGWWPPAGDERRDAREAALAEIPDDAVVSATYQFVPHLTHREGIYEFPNPFEERNFGVSGEGVPDPAVVEWVVADRSLLGEEDAEVLTTLEDSGDFRVMSDTDDIVVLRRTR